MPANLSTRNRGVSLASEGHTCFPTTSFKSDNQVDGPTPERILDVAYAFWLSKALLSAVELGVFSALANGPLDLPSLAGRTRVHERGAPDFFDALVTVGFLHKDTAGRYDNQPDTDHFLDRSKPSYIGGLLEHLNARHFQNWSRLTQALRTGKPQSGALAEGSYPALYSDKASQDVFLNGMTGGSLIAGRALTAIFPWDRYQTVIDIGSAQGCVPVEIARAHSHLTGGGFDLPAVEPAFIEYVSTHHLSGRLTFYSGDFLSNPLPNADVLIMGRILHNWDNATRLLLLRKAFQALSPSGALIVYDPLIDDARTKAHGLLSSLNMLIETKAGSEYSGAECRAWMLQAGFQDIHIKPLDDIHSAVIGTKPDGFKDPTSSKLIG